ncbi:MAG TPA: hypothetical protein VN037_00375 [Verrucomicrobiae bacterium]|nr:hypothetical protein [Verrucomicrobiae bacterium]
MKTRSDAVKNLCMVMTAPNAAPKNIATTALTLLANQEVCHVKCGSPAPQFGFLVSATTQRKEGSTGRWLWAELEDRPARWSF